MKPSPVLERRSQIRLTLAEDHSDQEGRPSTVRLLSTCQLIPSWKSVSHTNKHMHLSTAESRRRGKWQRHKEPSYCSRWGFAKQDVPFISRSLCVCCTWMSCCTCGFSSRSLQKDAVWDFGCSRSQRLPWIHPSINQVSQIQLQYCLMLFSEGFIYRHGVEVNIYFSEFTLKDPNSVLYNMDIAAVGILTIWCDGAWENESGLKDGVNSWNPGGDWENWKLQLLLKGHRQTTEFTGLENERFQMTFKTSSITNEHFLCFSWINTGLRKCGSLHFIGKTKTKI